MTIIPQYVLWMIMGIIGVSLFIFGKKGYMPLLLIFVYLLPRGGFRITWPFPHPLPFGYILLAFTGIKWLFDKFLLLRNKTQMLYTPVTNIFKIYSVVCFSYLIMGLLSGAVMQHAFMDFGIYYLTFFIYFMIADYRFTKENAKSFINGLLIVAFLVSCYGILLMIIGEKGFIESITYNDSGKWWGLTDYHVALGTQFILARRTLSSYGDPNVLGSQLVFFICVIAALLFFRKSSPGNKFILSVNLLANIICLYLCGSRSALVAIIALLIIFAFYRLVSISIIASLFLISFVTFRSIIDKFYFHRIFKIGLESTLAILNPDIIFSLILKFPFGVGFGMAIDRNLGSSPSWSVWSGFNSFYLQIFTKIGFIGCILLILFVICLFRYFLVNYKYIEDETIKLFVWGATIGLIVQQPTFFANNIYMLPGGGMNYLVMCGILTAMIKLCKK